VKQKAAGNRGFFAFYFLKINGSLLEASRACWPRPFTIWRIAVI